MKKIISTLSILLLVFVGLFMITGCNKNTTDDENGVVILTDEVQYPADGKTRLVLNTSGMGQLAYFGNDKYKVDFNDKNPSQQIVTLLEGVEKVTIEAKANDGWKFVRWVDINDNEVSTETKYEVEIVSDQNNIYTAVFDAVE